MISGIFFIEKHAIQSTHHPHLFYCTVLTKEHPADRIFNCFGCFVCDGNGLLESVHEENPQSLPLHTNNIPSAKHLEKVLTPRHLFGTEALPRSINSTCS